MHYRKLTPPTLRLGKALLLVGLLGMNLHATVARDKSAANRQLLLGPLQRAFSLQAHFVFFLRNKLRTGPSPPTLCVCVCVCVESGYKSCSQYSAFSLCSLEYPVLNSVLSARVWLQLFLSIIVQSEPKSTEDFFFLMQQEWFCY